MVAFFAFATSALLVLPSVLADLVSSPSHLFARQIGGFDPSQIPTQCIEDKCKTIYTAATGNCLTLDCLCTPAITNSFKPCLQCLVDAQITGFNQTIVDQAFDAFLKGCAAGGHTVSDISGSTTTSGSPTIAGSGTSGSPTTAVSGTSESGTTSTKSGALAQMSTNILGVVFAVALGGVAFA